MLVSSEDYFPLSLSKEIITLIMSGGIADNILIFFPFYFTGDCQTTASQTGDWMR